MSKTILFFADGTWNGPGQDENDDKKGDQTNVFKMFVNLDGKDAAADVRSANEQERMLTDANGQVQQVAKYLHGVGDSDNFLVRVLGGTVGAGLITRILRGHTFISRNYQQNDKITILGFSRGAYTARSLAGFIAAKGLIDASKEDLNDKENAYRLSAALWYDYRKKAVQHNSDWFGKLEETVIDLPAFVSKPPTTNLVANVQMEAVAVFDTVGALGIPEYAKNQESRIDALQFCDTTLSHQVNHGIHAVSIDEQRIDFTPTLWDSDPRVTQVLFPGAHADVGGGYPLNESDLSDGAMQWMVDELKALGVKFSANPVSIPNANAKGVAHEPWSYPPFNATHRAYRQFAVGMPMHPSIQVRMSAGPVVPDPKRLAAPYNPPNTPGKVPPVIEWP